MSCLGSWSGNIQDGSTVDYPVWLGDGSGRTYSGWWTNNYTAASVVQVELSQSTEGAVGNSQITKSFLDPGRTAYLAPDQASFAGHWVRELPSQRRLSQVVAWNPTGADNNGMGAHLAMKVANDPAVQDVMSAPQRC